MMVKGIQFLLYLHYAFGGNTGVKFTDSIM